MPLEASQAALRAGVPSWGVELLHALGQRHWVEKWLYSYRHARLFLKLAREAYDETQYPKKVRLLELPLDHSSRDWGLVPVLHANSDLHFDCFLKFVDTDKFLWVEGEEAMPPSGLGRNGFLRGFLPYVPLSLGNALLEAVPAWVLDFLYRLEEPGYLRKFVYCPALGTLRVLISTEAYEDLPPPTRSVVGSSSYSRSFQLRGMEGYDFTGRSISKFCDETLFSAPYQDPLGVLLSWSREEGLDTKLLIEGLIGELEDQDKLRGFVWSNNFKNGAHLWLTEEACASEWPGYQLDLSSLSPLSKLAVTWVTYSTSVEAFEAHRVTRGGEWGEITPTQTERSHPIWLPYVLPEAWSIKGVWIQINPDFNVNTDQNPRSDRVRVRMVIKDYLGPGYTCTDEWRLIPGVYSQELRPISESEIDLKVLAEYYHAWPEARG